MTFEGDLGQRGLCGRKGLGVLGGVVALSYFPINSVGTTDLFLEKNQGSVLPHNRLNSSI